MTDQQSEDLRATAEDLLADAHRLEEIEARKLELAPDDPEMLALAAEGHAIARRMGPKAAAQWALAELLADDAAQRD